MACAPSKDSDQHPPSLIKVFAVSMKKAWVLSYPLSAQRRLIRMGRCPGWSEFSPCAQSFCWFYHEAAQMTYTEYCDVVFFSIFFIKVFYKKYEKFGRPKICCNYSKIWTVWFYRILVCPKYADWQANSVDPDQTAPPGTIWYGSTLFAQTSPNS